MKIWHELWVFYRKTYVHLWQYLAEFFLVWGMFFRQILQRNSKYFLCSITFFRKPCRFWDIVEECGRSLCNAACIVSVGIVNTTFCYFFNILLTVHPTGCPTPYRTRHFFNNFTTNEDIATKFHTHYRHIPLHISHKERTSVQISLQYLHWF